MTITQRLIISMSIMLSALLGLAFLNGWANTQMDTVLKEVIELTNARASINQATIYTRANREQVLLALQHNPANKEIVALHDHPLQMHLDTMEKNRVKAGEGIEALNKMKVVHGLLNTEMQNFYSLRSDYIKNGLSVVMDKIKSGDFFGANEFLIKSMNPMINKVFDAADVVFVKISEEVIKKEKEAEALSSMLHNISLIASILSLILGISILVLVVRSITSIVTGISSAVSYSAINMKFDTRLPARSDEFSGLSGSVNQLFESLQKGFSETNDVIAALAHGDMSKRISGNYSGDLESLKLGVNASVENISKVMSELSGAMNALESGDFKRQINTNAQGEYGKMLKNASEAIQAFSIVINEITQIMHQMSEGDFGIRVEANAKGDLLTMKNNINSSMTIIANTIHAISEVVEAQAEGDLTKELPSGTFKGQLHELKNAINYSSAKVKESVIQAIDASNIVNEAAMQVSQGSADLSGRVQEQAAALEETSATMNEMAAAVQANTSNAKKVAELAHQVQHQAGAGVDVMQQTIQAMQSIKESSSKIADIVTIIDGIAFQTNLLALNAAVEAARAGEHGRGFAVVAGEVRALAQKSAEAAKDIKDLINDSVGRIEAGTQLADRSGEMLSGITGSIEQVAEMIESIANASAEQSQGINQVHKAMGDIDRVTQENAALVEETTAAAESLSTEANHLKENMSFFKTGVTSHAHYQTKSSSKPVKRVNKSLPSPSNSNSNEWSSF